ncbi:MAG: tetratricopeptide repeat protein [Planctomycetota bacterium]|jgi:serine/threonine-protein kinase
MKVFKAVLIAIVLIFHLAFISIFSCGCGGPDTNGKQQHKYLSSQEGIEFQQGADQPPSMETLYSMATIFIHQGRFNEAELLLQRVINKNPKFLLAYNDLAETKIRNRRTSEAIEILSTAIKENSSDPTTFNNLGMCWIIRRDYEKALQMFTDAAGLEPENTRYRANMALALGLMERDNEALALYRQILPEEQANKNLSIIQQARSNVKNQ